MTLEQGSATPRSVLRAGWVLFGLARALKCWTIAVRSCCSSEEVESAQPRWRPQRAASSQTRIVCATESGINFTGSCVSKEVSSRATRVSIDCHGSCKYAMPDRIEQRDDRDMPNTAIVLSSERVARQGRQGPCALITWWGSNLAGHSENDMVKAVHLVGLSRHLLEVVCRDRVVELCQGYELTGSRARDSSHTESYLGRRRCQCRSQRFDGCWRMIVSLVMIFVGSTKDQ